MRRRYRRLAGELKGVMTLTEPPHGDAAAIEPEGVHLPGGAVAIDAVGAEYGHHVAAEIHFGGGRGGHGCGGEDREEEGGG